MKNIAAHICGNCGHLGSVHDPKGCHWSRCKCRQFRVGLTRREFQVLQQLALGKSRKEIGTALNMATKTVESHLYNMYSKTGADSAIQLVLAAVREKVLPLESLAPTIPPFVVIYVQPR